MPADNVVLLLTTVRQDGCSEDDVRMWKLRRDTGKTIKIGRADNNDIVLNLRGISAYHAEIRLADTSSKGSAGLILRDFSKNGTGLLRPGLSCSLLEAEKDVSLPQGSALEVPMRTKNGEPRAWISFRILSEAKDAANSRALTLKASMARPKSSAGGKPGSQPEKNSSVVAKVATLAMPASKSKQQEIRRQDQEGVADDLEPLKRRKQRVEQTEDVENEGAVRRDPYYCPPRDRSRDGSRGRSRNRSRSRNHDRGKGRLKVEVASPQTDQRVTLRPRKGDRIVPHARFYRSKIRDMYEKYNPAKFREVDNILEKYAGLEDQLYDALCEKYILGYNRKITPL